MSYFFPPSMNGYLYMTVKGICLQQKTVLAFSFQQTVMHTTKNVDTPDEGYYWTSTFSNIDNAYVTYLPSNSWGISYYDRYIGIGIRAVKMN